MRIFKDDNKEQRFRDKGFVVSPIAEPSDLKQIEDLYHSIGKKDTGLNFYTTIWVDDKAHRQEVNAAIRDFIFPRVEEQLEDFVPVFGNFMVKHAGAGSALGLHQDWTFVNEPDVRSINVWLQITPASLENGPLLVVPHSHHFGDIIRGRHITSPFDQIFPQIKKNHAIPVLPKSGEAVIFDNALMHGSDDNQTDLDRIAISLVLKPRTAQLYHYYRLEEKAEPVYKSKIEPSFYTDYGLFDSLVALPGKSTVELNLPPISLDRFKMMLNYFENEHQKMSIFRDEQHNQEFREKGFVVFPSFLSPDEIVHLKKFYEDHPLPDAQGFHATSHSKQPDYKRLVHKTITDVVREKAQKLLKGYRPLTSSYTVKEVGTNSEFQSHLDWNMVDEAKCISITMWCALMDTNAVNGNIYMLEKSHTLGPTIRSGKGLYLHVLNDNYKSAKFKRRVLQLKAGDMVLYDHRVFHGSPPNLSDKTRISFNHVMVPEDVSSVHYFTGGRR